jgi:phenylacetate-coenzyme A ligase PaaK-like adenylate-forming protein
MQGFVRDGDCGRGILTTLLPPGGKSGMLLLNYDTEDTTLVLSRGRCRCGRTHMRIHTPQREAETAWIFGNALGRVDVEAGVFQPENMEYITGEYEAFIYEGESLDEVVFRISVECMDHDRCDRKLVENQLIGRFLKYKPGLASQYHDGKLKISINFTGPGGLELHNQKGRPKRLIDRRKQA